MEEKKHIGKFDLPQSIGFIIARLIQQRFPLEGGSAKRDGILILVFNDDDRIEQNKTIELEYNSLYFKYQLIDTDTIFGEKNCPYCDKPHMRPTFHAFYELKEIWQDKDNVTERYKIGGDSTESKTSSSAL